MDDYKISSVLTLQSVEQNLHPDLSNNNNNETEIEMDIDLENDGLYLEFRDQPSSDIGQYLKSAVNNPSTSLKKLQHTLKKIDIHIRKEVVQRHSCLLSQSDDVHKLQNDLQLIHQKVNEQQLNMSRIRNAIIQPFTTYKKLSNQNKKLLIAEKYLRNILRFKKLLTQLNTYFNANSQKKDLIKSALIINEIQYIFDTKNISGIAIFEEKRNFIESVEQQIKDLAKEKLFNGLRNLQQSNIAVALQVFFNLDLMSTMISNVKQTLIEQCTQYLKKCLMPTSTDMKSMEDSSTANSNNITAVIMNDTTIVNESILETSQISWKSSILLQLDLCVNQHFFNAILQIWNLEKVLHKIQNENTNSYCNQSYFQILNSNGQLFSTQIFCLQLINILKTELENASEKSAFLSNILINEYPRIYHMIDVLTEKVLQTMSNMNCAFIQSIEKYEIAFLSKCNFRISQPLLILFNNQELNRIPTIADMRTLFTHFYNELKISEECSVVQLKIMEDIVFEGVQKMILHLDKKLIDIKIDSSFGDSFGANVKFDMIHNLDIFNTIQALDRHFTLLLNEKKRNQIIFSDECRKYIQQSSSIMCNFNGYVLYEKCLILMYPTIINLMMVDDDRLLKYFQFLSLEVFPLAQKGIIRDNIYGLFFECVTVLFLQMKCLQIYKGVKDVERREWLANNLCQYLECLRVFEHAHKLNILPSILMIQQFKKICFNEIWMDVEMERRDLSVFYELYSHMPQFIVAQFVIFFIDGDFKSEMNVKQFINEYWIMDHFLNLYPFSMEEASEVDMEVVIEVKKLTVNQKKWIEDNISLS